MIKFLVVLGIQRKRAKDSIGTEVYAEYKEGKEFVNEM